MAVSPVYHMRLAPDERLAWQLQAKSEGLSLAAWIKAACDAALNRSGGALGEPSGARTGSQGSPVDPSASERRSTDERRDGLVSRSPHVLGSSSVPSFVPASPVRLGKRSYEPDPR